MKFFSIPKSVLISLSFPFMLSASPVALTKLVDSKQEKRQEQVISAKKINDTSIEILLTGNKKLILDFYGENIFRLFQDNAGGLLRDPEAKPSAKILVDHPRKPIANLTLTDSNLHLTISSATIDVLVDKKTSLIKVINHATKAVVLEEIAPIGIEKGKVTITLKENSDEYFYG